MTRQRILEILGDLPYALIWPGSWEDVGYTERELWVNKHGYGYILCDEPTACWEGEGVTDNKWHEIEEKLLEDSIEYEDIKGTSIETTLNALYCDDFDFDDRESLIDALNGLLSLPKGAATYFYAMQTQFGPEFFDSENAFKTAYEKDTADTEWAELDYNTLRKWIKRLVSDDNPKLQLWATKNHISPDKHT